MQKETRMLMGMPVTVHLSDREDAKDAIQKVFEYFTYVDETFSTYKDTSEITKINLGLLKKEDWSQDMKTVFALSEQTKKETEGYFDIMKNDGSYDPSGMVKGWAIYHVSNILKDAGFKNFYVDAGGDIQAHGRNEKNHSWKIGIKNPFNLQEIIKVVYLKNNEGLATSGTYERGQHIYNPKNRKQMMAEIISFTVIGPNIYEADRFATAAFAMQKEGIHFIETLNGFAGYMVDNHGKATMTSNFELYTKE